MIPNASKCSMCGDQSHNCENCPTLHEPTKQGFYKPSGGGGGHSHGDDDDEKMDIKHKPNLNFKYQYENLKAKL